MSSESILLAIHRRDLRAQVFNALTGHTGKIRSAPTVQRALEETEQSRASLLIIELSLPPSGGLTLVSRIKSRLRPHPGFLFVTMEDDDTNPVRFRCDALLRLPIDAEELSAKIAAYRMADPEATPVPELPRPLGEHLLDAGTITAEQLQAALTSQKNDRRPLGEILARDHGIDERAIAEVIARQRNLRLTDPDHAPIDHRALALINKRYALSHSVYPLAVVGSATRPRVVISMANPNDLRLKDDIQFMTGMVVEETISSPSAIRRAIIQAYE